MVMIEFTCEGKFQEGRSGGRLLAKQAAEQF